MDVPFLSSGAMSRAHYALVRKVETAASSYAADTVLLAEVEAIQGRLLHSTLNLKQVKESLILLLYCSMTVNHDVDLDVLFALPHAISLAEAGKTIQDKRIGYLFCAECMPKHHELQLMLVNTLRKDLESHAVPRICLALDTLLHFSPEDIVPAIQDRLYDLLSHNSPHVKRRTLLVYRALSQQDRDILRHVVDKTRKRLEDHEPIVIAAALALASELVDNKLLSPRTFHPILTKLLHNAIHGKSVRQNPYLLRRILGAIRDVKPTEEDLKLILQLVPSRLPRVPSTIILRYQCFLTIESSSETLIAKYPSCGATLIQPIRNLLTSEEPNETYAFLSSLCCLDPQLWSGSLPGTSSVVEAWEVERIMCQLESPDATIRRKTMKLLFAVDRNIIEAYFTKLSSGNFSSLPVDNHGDLLKRPLEVIEFLSGEDGESYAQHIIQMLIVVEGEPRGHQVIEGAVEDILTCIRRGDVNFRSGCIGALFAILDEGEKQSGPTLTTIYSALVCEYLDVSLVSPEKLLRALSRLLPMQSAAIQDACILSMIRVAASCDTISSEVTEVVRKVQQTGGRHIRRRCEQFLTLSVDHPALRNILSHTKSSSLPDFLVALEAYSAEQRASTSGSSSVPTSPERSSSRLSQSTTTSKLRYAAYDPPKATSKLRRLSTSSSHSNSTVGIRRRDSEESLSRTFTPGELALAAGRPQLEELSKSPKFSTPLLPTVQIMDEDELASRVDLIAFDSPFLTDPPGASSIASSVIEPDFEKIWDVLAKGNSRGWCESAIEEVVRRLQGMKDRRMTVKPADQPPFEGDLKILIYTSGGESVDHQPSAALRLKESDDESCLWHLRCTDEGLRKDIKSLLTDS